MKENYYFYEKNEYGYYAEDFGGYKIWSGNNSNRYLYGRELSQTVREALKAEKVKGVGIKLDNFNEGQALHITIKAKPTDFISKTEYIENGDYGNIIRAGFFYEGVRENNGKKEYIRNKDIDLIFNAPSPEEQEKMLRTHRSYEYDYIREQEELRPWDCLGICTKEFLHKLEKIEGTVMSFNYTKNNDYTDYHEFLFYSHYYIKPTQLYIAEETDNNN